MSDYRFVKDGELRTGSPCESCGGSSAFRRANGRVLCPRCQVIQESTPGIRKESESHQSLRESIDYLADRHI